MIEQIKSILIERYAGRKWAGELPHELTAKEIDALYQSQLNAVTAERDARETKSIELLESLYYHYLDSKVGMKKEAETIKAAISLLKCGKPYWTTENQPTDLTTQLNAVTAENKRLRKLLKNPTGIKCECGSMNIDDTGGGGFQEADASRRLPEIDAQEVGCNDCGRTWYE